MNSFRPSGRAAKGRSSGFTLLELMVVLALLTVTVGLAIPRLASFFRGRALDSEARRVLAFTRYAQERATSEGIPMRVWFDSKSGAYGVRRDPSYQETDESGEQDVTMDPAIRLEVAESQQPSQATRRITQSNTARKSDKYDGLPAIEFLPDGAIGSGSPERVVLRDSEDHVIVLSRSENRLSYELSDK